MSSNSWRQYGGINRLDSFNTIQAGTIVADQFLSRSVKPSYQFYNGTIEVTVNLIADQDLIAGNSLYVGIDSFIAGNSYANKKLYFGQTNTLPDSNTWAFMAGNSTNIGVNTTAPSTVFNIVGRLPTVTDILTVESTNGYIRNILGQNVNQRGLVLDAFNSTTNLYFFNDTSTNKTNLANASISYNTGGTLSSWTSNLITASARAFQYTNSGGVLQFDGYKTKWDSSGWFIYNTSGGIIWNSSGDYMKLDSLNGNFLLNTSGDMVLQSAQGYYLNTSGGLLSLNKNTGILSCSGSILLNSSAGIINVTSNLGTGNIYIKSNTSQFTSFLTVAPPPLTTQTTASGELYNETVLIYDNSNNTYLYDNYQVSSSQTGTALTMVSVDNSSNTFFRAVAPNNMGAAINGGVFPLDPSRSMMNIGLSDICQNYIPNQTIVTGNSKTRYLSTVGINTYAPRTESYSLDINGPTHLGNGEINTIARVGYEIKYMLFSKINSQSGIAVGSISSYASTAYSSSYYILYTKNGGQSWTNSQVIINNVTSASAITLTGNMYDTSYAMIATRNTTVSNVIESKHYTSNGGATWSNIGYLGDNNARYTGSLYIATSPSLTNSIRTFHAYYYHTAYGNNFLRWFDIYKSSLTGATYSIPTNTEILLGINSVASDSGGSFVYFVGSGIAKVSISTPTLVYSNSRTDTSYNNVFAYNDNYVIAVGNNILSYTTNGATWTDISTNQVIPGTSSRFAATSASTVNLQSVYIYDLSRAVAVGDNGILIFTVAGPEPRAWTIDVSNTLNSSGMGSQITGSGNMLRGVNMQDLNSYIIASVTTLNSSSTGVAGASKLLYGFFPNLMNRVNNRVFDVCGNMYISGDINVNDLGLIASNNQTFFLLNNVVRTLNFVRDSSFINIANFNTNTTLNGNLFVTNNSFMALDVSMANRLFVLADTSLNANTFVQGNLSLPASSSIFTSIVNSSSLSPLYNSSGANNIGNLVVGGNTLVTSLGYLDPTRYNAISNQIQSANNRGSYINIGSVNPLYDASTVSINIGNWSTNVGAKSNYINMGGGTDLVTLAGNIFFKNTQKLLVNNPVIIVNNQTNTGVNSSSGISGYTSGTTLTIVSAAASTNIAVGQIITGGNISSGTTVTALITGTGGVGTYTISPSQTLATGSIGSPVALTFTTNYASTGTTGYIAGGNLVVMTISTGTILIGQSVTVAGSSSAVVITGFVAGSGNAGQAGTYTVTATPSVTTFASAAAPVALTFLPSTVQLANGYGTSSGSGLYINDNNIQNSGYMVVSYDMSAFNFRATNTNSNVVRLDTNSMTLYSGSTFNTKTGINSMNNGLVTLTRSIGTALADSSYTLSVAQIDISNILLRDSNTSNDTTQNILTGVTIQGDVSMNNRLFVLNDASFIGNVYINQDINIRGRLTVREYQSRIIINTTTTNYQQFLVDQDMSLNGRLVVTQDVSMSARLFLGSDASFSSRLNVGGDVSLNSRIFVAGDASFGSRVNVGGDVSLNSRLFVAGDASFGSRVNVGGDVSLNSRLFVAGDASFGSRVNIGGDVSLNSRLFVGGDASLNSRVNIGGDVSMNSRLFVAADVSLNANLYVAQFAGFGVSGTMFSLDVSGNVNLRGTTNPITLIDNSVLLSNSTPLDTSNNFGTNWIQNFANSVYSWSGACMSSLGQYQIVWSKTLTSGNSGNLYIYQSNDFGVTWFSPLNSGAAGNNPAGVAISATGQYVAFDISNNGIYLSSTFGSTYSQVSSQSLAYSCIAISATGQYLTAGTIGLLWISTNYGATWLSQTTGSLSWSAVAMSANAQYQSAAVSGGFLYSNYNFGLANSVGAWTAVTAVNKTWTGIAVSSSGQYQSACESTGIWTSVNYGVSWTQKSTISGWTAISISSSGQFQIATLSSGATYVSNNYGTSWSIRSGAPTGGTGAAIAGNGQYMLVSNSTGTWNTTVPYPSMYINNGLSVIADMSMNGRMMVYGDVSFNSRLYVQGDMSLNRRLFVGGDVSLNSRLNVIADVSLSSRLFVGGDVSMNMRLYVQNNLYVGFGAGTAISGNRNTFTLDISAAGTNSSFYAGAMRIWEASGTLPTASGGTLFLQHNDASGVSSIVFPSTTNFGNDFASIAYYESISGGLSAASKYNYYSNSSSTSSSALVLNVQSNPYNSGSNVTTIDSIILQPAGSCIIDACGSTMGQTIIQPRGGTVGIGKINSLYPLDVTSQPVSYSATGSPTVSTLGNFTFLTFSTAGTSTLTINSSSLYSSIQIGYILVGGGGGGGNGGGSGPGSGGAGGCVTYGFINSSPTAVLNLATTTQYTVTVGSGGSAGNSGGSTSLAGGSISLSAGGGTLGGSNGSITNAGVNGGTLAGSGGAISTTATGGAANGVNGSTSAVLYSVDIGYNQFGATGGGGGTASRGGSGGTLSAAGITGASGTISGTAGALGCGGGGGASGGGTGGSGGNGYVILYFNTFINQPAAASINNALLINNGFVGIGLGAAANGNLNTPSFPLDISSASLAGTVRLGGNISYPPVGSSPYSGQLILTANANYNASKLVMGMSYSSSSAQAGYIQSTQFSGSTDTTQILLLNPAGGNVAVGKTTANFALDISGTINSSGAVIFGGDVSLNSRLFVSRDVSLNANLYALGSLTIAGTSLSTISGNLNVTSTNASVFSGNLTAANLLTGGNLTVSGTSLSTISGNLNVTSANASVFSGNLTAANLLTGGNLTVSGTSLTTIAGNLNVTSTNASVFSGNLTVNNYMAVGPSSSLSASYVLNANGNIQATGYNATSDIRIKSNIMNIDGKFALDTLRRIEPKQFRFVEDRIDNKLSWGFIAQEIDQVLEHITTKSTNFIPNVYDYGQVYNTNMIQLETKTTNRFIDGASQVRIVSDISGSQIYDLVNIIDTNTFTISPPILGTDRVFVYGQQVDDFMSINHNSIFTLSTAAIKQIDKELQETKQIMENQARQILELQKRIEDRVR